MSTHDEIRRLADGSFHSLGDDLLRRLSPRYRRLRKHGLNACGESIKGQPDSYVGETASTASIAVCYTVQKSGWWKKVVQDVRAAVVASPLAMEVVIVVPHNVDRDGPKDKTIDWHLQAQEAAGNARLYIIDGREISNLLDSDHQDLRYQYLGTPYSRLSLFSIFESCRAASRDAIETIKASGRYDPLRYSTRSADRELYQQWQSAFYKDNDSRRVSPVSLISLVNDSGVGKTSLVCEFTRTLGTVLPVVLLQARDLTFGSEDNLVASVIHAIQGVLDPATRVIEEAALTKLLDGSAKLTVVVDGLDESHNCDGVRRAINYWLKSKLSTVSILITTARREFWRTCVDSTWARWMPNAEPGTNSTTEIATRSQVEKTDPAYGVRIPDLFTEEELEAAWLRAGRNRSDLLTLSVDARAELRHPFTLRTFLEVISQEGIPAIKITKAALLELWLNRRLDVESLPQERITQSHFQTALQVVAGQIAESNTGSVSVDSLTNVPRFDSTRPPGPVLQRLIDASILESLPRQTDHIRFTVEAVQDFYLAEADVGKIKNDVKSMVEIFSKLTFSSAYTRLVRIGSRIVTEEVCHEFIRLLLHVDVRKAAILLRASPSHYDPEIRAKIADELGTQIKARHRVRAAMAISLLSDLTCGEAVDALVNHFMQTTESDKHLKSLGANAFVKLSCAKEASFVYRWQHFGIYYGNEIHFSRDLLARVRAATPEFQSALADQAIVELKHESGTWEHAKAVVVLAYLRDPRLVSHLKTRLASNGLLNYYENYALIALGSDKAGALFTSVAKAVGNRLNLLPDDCTNNDARYKLGCLVRFMDYDIRYFITSALEPHIQRLIEDSDGEVAWMGIDLAMRANVVSLYYAVAQVTSRGAWLDYYRYGHRDSVNPTEWLGWWRRSSDNAIRRKLLGLLPRYPNPEIEQILLDCLECRDFCAAAARFLGEYGAIRAAPRLREIISDAVIDDDKREKSAAAKALGDMRDDGAVKILARLASSYSDPWINSQVIKSLSCIGNDEAESALEQLLEIPREEYFQDLVFEALLYCGSQTAVSKVIRKASERTDGAEWLCERLCRLKMIRGWRRGEFYTHIHTKDLVDYLRIHFKPSSPERNCRFGDALAQIDSSEVRALLRNWASKQGSPEDPSVREGDHYKISDMCFETLRERGDFSAIEFTFEQRADEEDDNYVILTANCLRSFPIEAVADQIRARLERATSTSEIVRMLALLGRFGQQVDHELALPYLNHADDLVANVACEVMLRLSDPLLIPN
jgi:hypothetical protein